MDSLNKLEIYIPVAAEVKRISVQSLPDSMLRRMGIPLSDPDISRKLADSPEGIWISPAVLQRRGQKLTSHTGNGAMENIRSAVATELCIKSGPLRMSIVSPNHTAYEVLKDTTPGTRRSPTLLLDQGSALQTNRDAVVVYRGSVYLFMKRHSRSQGHPETRSATPLTSHVSSKSQKKELLSDRRPKKKHTTCKVTHRANKTDVIQMNLSTSKTMCPVPLPTDSVHTMDSQSHENAFHSQGEQEELVNSGGAECKMQELGDEKAKSIIQNSDMSSTIQMDSGEDDPSSSQGRTMRESVEAAASSSSGPMECVFKELAQVEEIALVKAKLSSALKNLPLSK